jgi:hypothetical protein
MTHHGPDSGDATTILPIVYYAFAHGSGIQMALFPRTPEVESRNYPGLDSRSFGTSYLLAPTSDRDEVLTKVVALEESFPTPCRTLGTHVENRSIPDF